MPGVTIHLAAAKQYIKKHKGEIKNEEEFIKGTFAPDVDYTTGETQKDKDKTHYGKWGKATTTDLNKFLKDDKVDISSDYWKGYFIHLLVDHYFYNKYFTYEKECVIENTDSFYNDYDCLNDILIKEYELKVPESLEKFMKTAKGELRYLEEEKVIGFINKVSEWGLNEQIQRIKKYGMNGLEE